MAWSIAVKHTSFFSILKPVFHAESNLYVACSSPLVATVKVIKTLCSFCMCCLCSKSVIAYWYKTFKTSILCFIFFMFLFYPLFKQEWPKFHNCRIIHCDRMKIHTQHATLAKFRKINVFPDYMGLQL